VSGGSLRCLNGHSYDIARDGYVNLLPGGARPGTADTREMVAARESFLAAGLFAGLRERISDEAERAVAGGGDRVPAVPGAIVEVGAGTGYYLAAVLDRLPGRLGLALDISKFAARRAAHAHARIAAVVGDAWTELPVADSCASLVLDIFAPRNPSEFGRVLRPDGTLLVVTPSGRHLQELVAALGLLKVDERKPDRLERALASGFRLVEKTGYEQRLDLTTAQAAALAAMGPSARHVPLEEVQTRLQGQDETIDVTLSVIVARYAPRLGG
jgi:23S rRNA (guanine745-N1)-methyltransferase